METPATEPVIPGKRTRPIDLADIAQRWCVPLLLLAVLFAAAAFVASARLAKPVYAAEGQLLLSQEVEGTLSSGSQRQFWNVRDEAATRIEEIKSVEVVSRGLAMLPEEEWPNLLTDLDSVDNAPGVLAWDLEVTHLAPSQLLSVKLESDNPNGLAETVNAVMEGLVQHLEDKKEAESTKRLRYLEAEAAVIRADIDTIQSNKTELAQKHSIHNFDREMENPYYELLIFTQQQYQTALDGSLRLRAQLEQAKQDYSTLRGNLPESSPGVIKLSMGVKETENAFDASKVLVMDLRDELEAVRKLFNESSSVLREGIVLTDNIEHLRGRLTRVEDRIRDIQLESKVPVHVSVQREALMPTEPTGSNFYKLFLALMGIPLVLAVGCVMVYEVTYTKVRSRKELGEALGALPAESIPIFGKASGRSVLCVRDFPSNLCSVALRKLAFKLHQDQDLNDAKVFFFTGASRKSGVSWIANNVGEALTQYNPKVLTLKLDYASGELPEPSTEEQDNALLDEVMERLSRHETQRCQLDLATEMTFIQNRNLLKRFLKRAQAEYGAIVIDGPPLNDSDLSLFLASRADAAVVVAAKNKSEYKDVRTCIEGLAAVKVPAVTAVLNYERPQGSFRPFRQKPARKARFQVSAKSQEVPSAS